MAKITGIGGVFLKYNEDQKHLIKWYEQKLNITVSAYGLIFLKPNIFSLVTFNWKSDHEVILNFTVDNLDQFMDELIEKDVLIVREVKESDYGKFSIIKDLHGNVIELWEPYPK